MVGSINYGVLYSGTQGQRVMGKTIVDTTDDCPDYIHKR